MSARSVGLVYDEWMTLHHHPQDDPFDDYNGTTDHPESPMRIMSIFKHLDEVRVS